MVAALPRLIERSEGTKRTIPSSGHSERLTAGRPEDVLETKVVSGPVPLGRQLLLVVASEAADHSSLCEGACWAGPVGLARRSPCGLVLDRLLQCAAHSSERDFPTHLRRQIVDQRAAVDDPIPADALGLWRFCGLLLRDSLERRLHGRGCGLRDALGHREHRQSTPRGEKKVWRGANQPADIHFV
eukprot:scaffold13160_cov81-Phaeocystis_antarctica.AAC.5